MGRGLSPLQTNILVFLSTNNCITVRALFEHLSSSRPALSRSISRLQDRGLVERISLKVGRRNAPAVQLTHKNLTDGKNCGDLAGSDSQANNENKAVSEIGGADPLATNY
jgi:hypothetical protein